MTDLSPAAQAVLDAFTEDNSLHDWKHNHYNIDALAAALRAVADQVLAAQWEGRIEPDAAHSIGINWTRDALFAIAAELDGSTVDEYGYPLKLGDFYAS